LTIVFLIPSIIFAASHYGGVGAGYVWVGINVIYLLTWLGYVHKKIVPGLHCSWLWHDVIKIFFPALFVAILLNLYHFSTIDRMGCILFALYIGVACLVVSSMVSFSVRDKLLRWIFV
jgi:hypothetical protein